MLVLSRKIGQKIVIGTGDTTITLCVVDIDREQVKLGIDAPKDVRIDRLEVSQARLTNPRPPKESPDA